MKFFEVFYVLLLFILAWYLGKLLQYSIEKGSGDFLKKVKQIHPDQDLVLKDHDVIYFKDKKTGNFTVFYLQPDGAIKTVECGSKLPEFRWG